MSALITIPKGDGALGALSDLARPFALYATTISAAATPIIAILRMDPKHIDLGSLAALMTPLLAGVAALYAAKSAEQANIVKSNAAVAQAQAAAGGASQP